MTHTTHSFTDREIYGIIYELMDGFVGDSVTLTIREVSKRLMASRSGNHLHQSTDRKLSHQIRQAFLIIGFEYVQPGSIHVTGKYRFINNRWSNNPGTFQAVSAA